MTEDLLLMYGHYIIPAVYAICFGLLAWAVAEALHDGADNYASMYASETSRALEDLFLFIPPRRIADLARTAGALFFVFAFMLFGNFRSPAGLFTGLVMGGFFAGVALMSPKLLVKVLRKRRLKRFNLQLVDALISMSNALKAGFSISQAFESIVKEGEQPIAQEFSVFLQQTRIGVRFEDALANLEERVESEDLTIVARAIEIARQTGGNLTEVFEKIAETIRARMALEGKIDAMTAMGRLQGIIVGLIPIALMVAMTMLDPQMMMNFYTSIPGISILSAVVIMEVIGFLIIRKIVNIDV